MRRGVSLPILGILGPYLERELQVTTGRRNHERHA